MNKVLNTAYLSLFLLILSTSSVFANADFIPLTYSNTNNFVEKALSYLPNLTSDSSVVLDSSQLNQSSQAYEASTTANEKAVVQIELMPVTITGYSSSVDETDSTPFITASGKKVHDGIVASNQFPFGTKLKFPDYFGNKIFIVEDRMNRKFADRIDIWFPSKKIALDFGKKVLNVEVDTGSN